MHICEIKYTLPTGTEVYLSLTQAAQETVVFMDMFYDGERKAAFQFDNFGDAMHAVTHTIRTMKEL